MEKPTKIQKTQPTKIKFETIRNEYLNPKNFTECESIVCSRCRGADDLRPGYTLDQSCRVRMELKETERLSGTHRT